MIELSRGIILGNRILDIVLVSCFLAQVYKVFSPLLHRKRIDWVRMFQTGGMPSSHAATVVSLMTSVGIVYGFKSGILAMAATLAGVVIYDATGIRAAAGEHAKALNKIIENVEKKDGIEIIEKKFKEFLGHTSKEVFFGSVLGCITTLLFKNYLLG